MPPASRSLRTSRPSPPSISRAPICSAWLPQHLSKTGKLGSVSAFAIPELITSINAFTLGAQAVNPDIEVSVVWVNSWFDPAKEQEAAKALMAQKCDVIFSNAQDTPSVISACEEAGVYAFNLNSSMKKYAPKTYLGCIATDWSPFFKASVDAHLAGTFKGANAFLGVADKVVEVVDWNPDIPADVMTKIKEIEVKIADGSFSPFTGPITKADGSEGVAAGATHGRPRDHRDELARQGRHHAAAEVSHDHARSCRCAAFRRATARSMPIRPSIWTWRRNRSMRSSEKTGRANRR